MYGRKTRFVFAMMVFLMAIGYPLMLMSGMPAFQSLFLGESVGNKATLKIIDSARDKVARYDCAEADAPGTGASTQAGKAAAKGSAKSDTTPLTRSQVKHCKTALRELGSAYSTLAAPDEVTGEPPADAQDNLDKAREAFELLYAVDRKDDESAQLLGNAYRFSGKYALALPLFRTLAKQQPDDPDLTYAWADTAQAAQEFDEAISAYRRFLKLAPDDPQADAAKQAIKSLKEQQKNGTPGGPGAGASGLPPGLNIS